MRGESVQLPPHEGIDDTVYGSLVVYRQEIIDELNSYVANHSFKELDDQMETAINNSKDPDKFSQIWNVVKAELSDFVHQETIEIDVNERAAFLHQLRLFP